MDIYTKVLPYVYRLDNTLTGEFYIGYREANTEPSHLDFPKYKTSAPKVRENFDEFEWHIIAEFFNSNDAYDFEQLLIYENWSNPLLLNKSCFHGKGRFKSNSQPRSNETKLKISKTKTGTNIGHVAYNKGLAMSEESKLKISKSRTGLKIPQRIIECPYCNKRGGAANMKRYHLSNCKIAI